LLFCSTEIISKDTFVREGRRVQNSEKLIRIINPEINPPSLKDNTADVDRIIKAAKRSIGQKDISMALSLIKETPEKLRANNYRVSLCIFETEDRAEIIDIYGMDPSRDIYGIAVDLGSSTIVMRLMRLSDMKKIDQITFKNPQIKVGADILARIHFASKGDGLKKLQDMVVQAMNKEIEGLSKRHNVALDEIVGITVAGNTSMSHLFLGLTPYWICREPYIPVINKFEPLKASDVGLGINPRAPLIVFPNVGSYFGGDLIAGILVSGMARQKDDIYMLVDVGTNAEVVLGNADWLMACAGAAGPALEGGVANIGMIAGPGVIDKIRIDPDTLNIKYHTIDELPPIGICGSGIIDLVAQLFITGMIDMRGKFVPERCGNRLIEQDGIKYLIIVSSEESGTGQELTLSQPDIDSLIRSKAAMYTILTTIINTINISFKDIKKFYIAGTFGSYIDPVSAITIGMIPDLPLDTYVSLGNTSIEGASMLFSSYSYYDEMFRIRDMITYMELNVNQEFMQLFSAAKFIPHTDRSLFPSVRQYNEKNTKNKEGV